MKNLAKALMAIAVLFMANPLYSALAEGGHSHHGATAEAVQAAATIHSIDMDKRVVNVTHEPIPQISWPAMTMDLHVADDVDLSSFAVGQDVTITLARGDDGIYHIIAME